MTDPNGLNNPNRLNDPNILNDPNRLNDTVEIRLNEAIGNRFLSNYRPTPGQPISADLLDSLPCDDPRQTQCKPTFFNNIRIFFSVFHSIITLVAIYLTFRCNGKFHFGSFLVALLFPYIYIIYILATKGICSNTNTNTNANTENENENQE